MGNKIKFGLFILVSLCVAYFGLSYLRGINLLSSTTNTYYIALNHNIGVKQRDRVIFQGMLVGHVKSIKMDYEKLNDIKVTLSVDKKLKLDKNTVAHLLYGGIIVGLGSGCIELHSRGNSLDSLPNFAYIKSCIDPGISNAIPAALKSVEELLSVTNHFLVEIGKNTVRISNIFENLDIVTKQLSVLIANNEKNIEGIGREIHKLLAALNSKDQGISSILTHVNELLVFLDKNIKNNYAPSIANALAAINDVLDKTTKKENSLGKLLASDVLYRNLNSSIISANDLLINIKKHPSRYVNFSVFQLNRDEK